MAEIKVGNVEALGKPLGQYSHMTRVKNARRTEVRISSSSWAISAAPVSRAA